VRKIFQFIVNHLATLDQQCYLNELSQLIERDFSGRLRQLSDAFHGIQQFQVFIEILSTLIKYIDK
jgi:hypothetical protein